jgi:hypothetical protein
MLILNYGTILTGRDRVDIGLLFMMAFLHILLGLLQFYFLYIIYRALRYLKEVILCPYKEYREREQSRKRLQCSTNVIYSKYL